MKILVMSDSHSSLRVMRRAVSCLHPDAMIHLGDYYEDGSVIAEENPQIRMHQVPGNCDQFRCLARVPEILCYEIGGVRMYMTHGHRHRVKESTGRLLAAARAEGAKIALYGHTHVPDCYQEPDGLWVMNPGTCGYAGGTVGLIEIQNGAIVSCRILNQSDLEEMV